MRLSICRIVKTLIHSHESVPTDKQSNKQTSKQTNKQTNKPNIIYNLIKKELDSLIVRGHGNVVVLANACVVSPTQTWTVLRQKMRLSICRIVKTLIQTMKVSLQTI